MMGRDKLLEPVDSVPLIRRQALAALTSGCPVVVLLPTGPGPKTDVLKDLPVRIETVPDADEGIAASLRRAAGLLVDGQSLGVLLPDVPGISGADICTVFDAFRGAGEESATRASDTAGRPGTPLFLPFRIARQFIGLTGDSGGKPLLDGEHVQLVPLLSLIHISEPTRLQ